MSKSKKILVYGLGSCLVFFAFGYFYLWYDGARIAEPSEKLTWIASDQIPNTKNAEPFLSRLALRNRWFVDDLGRTVTLRGINVGGSSKLPIGYTSRTDKGFFVNARTVSFVGRPFPLADANEHFARLHQWGFQFIRLLITWEAIEHAGPGHYDQEYLDYIYQLIKKAGDHGIRVFLDPHQDAWSRFTGGDGAPYWTLEAAGLDPPHFTETGAALLHSEEGDPFPKMIWPTNYFKLASATMFTLFFGGNDLAPGIKVDSVLIQDYLQQHFIRAIRQLALRVKDLPNVVGFEPMNEPSAGYIGQPRLDTLPLLKSGVMPTLFQGMAAGGGNRVEVGVWEFHLTGAKEISRRWINPQKRRAWRNGMPDIWQQQGVWGYDSLRRPVILRNDFFEKVNGKRVDFSRNYFRPFVEHFSNAIRDINPDWIIFVEPATFTKLPVFENTQNMVNASHWYDFVTLMTKHYYSLVNANEARKSLVLGRKNIRTDFAAVLAERRIETLRTMGNHPTLVGEFGIPFDLDKGASYSSGDFSDQEAAIDRCMNAVEANMLDYTYWNYTPDNDHAHGDQWNGEDLSVFSLDDQVNKSDLNSGGRALAAVVRPYARRISGTPIRYSFDKQKGEFLLVFKNDPLIHAATEIVLPDFHYRAGYDVRFTGGRLEKDTLRGVLYYYPDAAVGVHVVIVRKKDKPD